MKPASRASYNISAIPIWRRIVLDLLSVFYNEETTEHILVDVDVSCIKDMIDRYRQAGHHITMTAVLLKAIAMVQKNHPDSRTFPISSNRTVTFHDITAGFTVERIVAGQPSVFFGEIDSPQLKTLIEISQELESYQTAEIVELPKLAQQYRFALLPSFLRLAILRLATLSPAFRLNYMKSTFGLSSLGSLGVQAVIGPAVCPAVFGIGAIEPAIRVIDKQPAIRPSMTISLNFDNRVMSCYQAARLIRDLKDLLESAWEEAVPSIRKQALTNNR